MARQDCKKSLLRIKIPFSSQLSTPPPSFFCTDLQRLSFFQKRMLCTPVTHTQADKNPILCKIPQNRACRQGCNVVYFLYSLNSCFREKNNLPVLRTLYGKEGLIMSNEEKYLLVEESIAPDIFKNLLEAKK